jgi:glycerophosphoryl diester phosphodiesterase
MEELLNNGIRAMAWTVDDPAEMKRLAGMGVDSLITNEPLLALDVLGR